MTDYQLPHGTVRVDGDTVTRLWDGVTFPLEPGMEEALARNAAAAAEQAAAQAARDAAMASLERPAVITGSTVAQVKASATAEVERIRAAVSVIIGG